MSAVGPLFRVCVCAVYIVCSIPSNTISPPGCEVKIGMSACGWREEASLCLYSVAICCCGGMDEEGGIIGLKFLGKSPQQQHAAPKGKGKGEMMIMRLAQFKGPIRAFQDTHTRYEEVERRE